MPVMTKIRNVDAIWTKGIISILRSAGGGRLSRERFGVTVYASNPARFMRIMDRIGNTRRGS